MIDAGSIDSFLRDPLGRFVRGATFLVWCADASLCGATYWGRPTANDARTLVRLYAIDEHPAMRRPFDVLTDAKRVWGVDPVAFAIIAEHVRRKVPAYAKRLRRNAVVHPEGMIGALIAGVYHLVSPEHAWRAFADVEAALAWLERSDGASLAVELTSLVDGGREDLVERLREVLATTTASPKAPTRLVDAAGRLGVSARSLQRSLAASGLTFRRLLARTRLERARELIEVGGKVEEIAMEAGFRTASGLRTAFRRSIGTPPSQVRRRR